MAQSFSEWQAKQGGAKPSPATTTPQAVSFSEWQAKKTQAEEPGYLERLKADAARRAQIVQEGKAASKAGEQSGFETFAQTLGQGIGMVTDIVAETPPIRLAEKGIEKLSETRPIKAVGEFVEPVVGRPLAKGIEEFETASPRTQRNIGALGNIASVLPIERAAAPVFSAAAKGVETAAPYVTKALPSQSKAVDALEQTYADLMSGTTPGKKKVSKLEAKTEVQNLAGTSGKTPMRTLAESGIIPKREGPKLSTFEQAENYRQTITPLRDANRAALEEAGLASEPISLVSLMQDALNEAHTPRNINAGVYEKMAKDIVSEFDALIRAYPEGRIPLSVVDDIKSARWDNVFKNKSIIEADVLKKNTEYTIAKALQRRIEKVSEELGNPEVGQLNREIGDRLEAAKFLEDLNGKTIKGGRAMKYVTTLIGSTIGQTLPGKIVGAIGGNLVGEIIIASNVATPTKRFLLRNLEKKDPAAYTKTIEWLNKQKLDRETRKLLPAPRYIPMGAPKVKEAKVIKVTEAAKNPVSVNPKTGKFQTTYSSQSKSPTAQQTKPATIADIKKPITKTIPKKEKVVKESGIKKAVKKTKEALKSVKKKYDAIPNKQGGFVTNPLAKVQKKSEEVATPASPKSTTKALPEDTFNVGITNVAGKTRTQSDVLFDEAKALLAKGDFPGAQKKYEESLKFGTKKIEDSFRDTGIKIKMKPGYGVFESTAEPSLDMTATVPKGKEDLFHTKLAELGKEMNQTSIITYRNATSENLGMVDKARGVANEPMYRIMLKEPLTLEQVPQIKALMDKHGVSGASVKDGGKTLDIINLTHYNSNYEGFIKNVHDLLEDKDFSGLYQSFERGPAETRHLGSTENDGLASYRRVFSDFYRKNPELKRQGNTEITSKVLSRLSQKATISKQELEQLLKAPDVSQIEKKVVADILKTYPDKFKRGDLERDIRKNVLRVTPAESDKYAQYGLDYLGGDFHDTGSAKTILYKTPVKHGVSGHFGTYDELGHIRVFTNKDLDKNGVFIAEMQSDPFQRGLNIEGDVKKQKESYESAIRKYKASRDEYEERVSRDEDYIYAKGRTALYKSFVRDFEKVLAVVQKLEDRGIEHIKESNFAGGIFTKLNTLARDIADAEESLVLRSTSEKSYSDTQDIVKGYKAKFDELLKSLEKVTAADATQISQLKALEKDNKYRRRLLEETLVDMKKRGYETVNIPTPSTVAKIEWGKGASEDVIPYENHLGDRFSTDDTVETGDEITYGGEDYTVVDGRGNEIIVAPSDKVRSFRLSEYMDDEINVRVEDAVYELKKIVKKERDDIIDVLKKEVTPEQASKILEDGVDDYDLQRVLEGIRDTEESMSVGDIENAVEEEIRKNFEPTDLRDIYGEDKVFSTPYGRYDEMVYIVDDGAHTETFGQPHTYESSGGEDFTAIDTDKKALKDFDFSDTELGVLDNYYDIQDNLKKIQKETDIKIEPVSFDDGNGNPTTWFQVTLNKNVKKTAF